MTAELKKAQATRQLAEHKLAAVRAQAEARAMEHTLRLLESPQPVVVPWREYPAADTWGMAPVGAARPYYWTNPDDRSDGRWLPIYEHAHDVRRIRAESRTLVELFPVCRSLLRKLSDYIIGTGWDFTVKPKKAHRNDPTAIQLATKVQGVLDRFLEYNGVVGNLDREMHEQSRIDGDVFAALYPEDGQVRLELTDPACILEPAEKRPLEIMLRTSHKLNAWQHGVHTVFHPVLKRDDVSRPLGYHAVFDRLGDQWDYLPAIRVEHIKRNLGRLARVGVPDFFFVKSDLENEAKLRRNTALGAAILAAIVMIREHAEGVTKSSIESMVSGSSTTNYERQTQDGARTTYSEQLRPGTIKDVPHGMKAMTGPMGSLNQPVYVEVDKHLLRVAGNWWSMPEYMSTGDASNANYASSLVAESPFVKFCEQEQGYYGGHYVRLNWKALKLHCEAGELRGCSWPQIRALLEIDGEYSSPASRDKKQQADVNKILSDAGLLSDRSFAADMGLDLDEELANGAVKAPPEPSPFGAPPGGSGFAAFARRSESTRHAAIEGAVRGALRGAATVEEVRAVLREAISENCGTGAGGFKGGNTCAGGGSASIEEITVGRENVKTYVNPPLRQLEAALEKHKELRALIDYDTGDVYVWPAEQATHSDFAAVVGIKVPEYAALPYFRDPARLEKNWRIMQSLAQKARSKAPVGESAESLRDPGAPGPLLETIKKLPDGKYRLYSHAGKNLGTFDTREAAEKHEREVQWFKHQKD